MTDSEERPSDEITDTLERISKSPTSYVAYTVKIALLEPMNRSEDKITLLMKILEQADKEGASYIFRFNGEAIVLLIQQSQTEGMAKALTKIRALFPNDPAVKPEANVPFINIYYLTTEMDNFKKEIARISSVITGRENAESRLIDAKKTDAEAIVPLSSDNLYAVIDVVNMIKVSDTIRRQPIIAVIDGHHTGVVFHEFFTSTAVLGKKMMPNINLLANKWLFSALTETLDIKLLDAIQNSHAPTTPARISVNLNLSTLASKDFDIFNFSMKSKGITIIAEVQPLDVFHNPELYTEIKQMLHRSGHKILLDALTADTLDFLNIDLLAPDLIKIFWTEKLNEPAATASVKRFTEAKNSIHTVLARCDSENALRWGAAQGIIFYQGNFIDTMLAATIKYNCSLSNCTIAECISRYSSFAGPLRDKCIYKNVLDSPPVWNGSL